MESEAPLSDDALAVVLARLPARSLAASRCVCKAWCGVVDDRGLLPPTLPHEVRGIFINFVDYWLAHPLFLARPSPVFPRIRVDIDFDSVLGHCNGLLLCCCGRDYYVVSPATRRWDRVPQPRVITGTYEPDHVPCIVFDPAVSPHYEVFLIPLVPEKPKPVDPSGIPPTTFNLNVFFSDDGTMGAEEVGEDEEY